MSFEQVRTQVREHFHKNPIVNIPKGHNKKGQRDPELEKEILDWVLYVLGDRDKPKSDFGKYIAQGCILSETMNKMVFHSITKEELEKGWACPSQVERVNELIRDLSRCGVKDVFKPDDLLKFQDIGKVARNLHELAKLAAKEKGLMPRA